MKTLGNNGPEREDWRSKFSKRENPKSLIIIENMRDKYEVV